MTSPLPRIAILGAPGTGATALAQALRDQVAPDQAALIHALPDDAAASLSPQDPRWTHAQLIVLMGLDSHGGTIHHGTPERYAGEQNTQEQADQQLRTSLLRAGKNFQVVYGTHSARLARVLQALNTIKNIADNEGNTPTSGLFDSKLEEKTLARPVLRPWGCEKCSDPECEHQLFSRLVQDRESRSRHPG